MLRILNEVRSYNDFQRMPGLRAHKLIGDRAGRWSQRIRQGWCITFVWDEEKAAASSVLIEDYH